MGLIIRGEGYVGAAPPSEEDPPDSFQEWRTPHEVFSTLNAAFGPFGLDAAADEQNAKCLSYLGEKENALSLDTKWLSATGNVWCNPPYRKVLDWVERADVAVQRDECARVVLLLNAEPGTKWFNRAVLNHEVQLFQGRVKFDLPPGMTNRRRPAKSQCVVIIEKDGFRGVTAIRRAADGVLLHDLTEIPR